MQHFLNYLFESLFKTRVEQGMSESSMQKQGGSLGSLPFMQWNPFPHDGEHDPGVHKYLSKIPNNSSPINFFKLGIDIRK